MLIRQNLSIGFYLWKLCIKDVCFCLHSAIGGASQHNSMPVPSSGKWAGKPENPVIPLKWGFYLLLFSSSYSYLKLFVLIHAWIAYTQISIRSLRGQISAQLLESSNSLLKRLTLKFCIIKLIVETCQSTSFF